MSRTTSFQHRIHAAMTNMSISPVSAEYRIPLPANHYIAAHVQANNRQIAGGCKWITAKVHADGRRMTGRYQAGNRQAAALQQAKHG